MLATGKGCGVWVSLSFFLALRNSWNWAGLGMRVAAHRVLLSISSGQTTMCPGGPGAFVRG